MVSQFCGNEDAEDVLFYAFVGANSIGENDYFRGVIGLVDQKNISIQFIIKSGELLSLAAEQYD